MNRATISADIISFTSLTNEDKRLVDSGIKQLLKVLANKFDKELFFGRVVQGDYIECALNSPHKALRIALLLKTFVKAVELHGRYTNDNRIKYFKDHGLRLAIAVAPLNTLNADEGIIDGDAIYLSGRAIKNQSTSNKEKIVIKNSLFFCSQDNVEQKKYEIMIALLDNIILRCSGKQCEVIFHKLMGLSEKMISEKLSKNQSTISQHSTAAGWQAIDKTVNYFEDNIQ